MKYLNMKKLWKNLQLMVVCLVISVITGCVSGNGNTDKNSNNAASKDSACVDTCTVKAIVAEQPTEDEQRVIIKFLTDMYNDDLYSDYDFLRNHCSESLLTMLENDYEYDHEGVAYAVWDFRTSAQDGKPDSDNLNNVISVEWAGDGWFTYEFYDQGWRGKKRVKASIKDGEVIMDALETLYDECYETYYQSEE